MNPAVLGVERSVTGRRWQARGGGEAAAVDRHGLAIAQRYGLPEIIGRLIAQRGIDLDDVERFLEPTLKAELPDPSLLKDMDAAAARLEGAAQIVCCARAEAGVVARHSRIPILPLRGAFRGRQCVCRLTELI